MNKIEKSENNNTQNMSSFKIEDIRRCFYCNKIPLIELIEKSYEFFIKYNCEIGHQGEVNLEEYLKNDKYSLKKLKCDECNKKQKNDFYLYNYCITCKKVLCHNCLKFHLEKEHQTNNFSRYDSICLKHNHNHNYNNYCNNCKKNICMLCLNEHKGHQIDSLSKYLDSENINNFDNKKNEVINVIEKIKKEIMEEYSNVIKYLDAYLNYINKNMIFSLINNLIDTYNFEKKLNNYNYEIIENLKNIEKIKFKYPDFSDCQNVFEIFKDIDNNNFIEIINKEPNENIKNFNVLKYEFYKPLNYHKDTVNQIILLKDGRIASSSNDKSILIYDKEMKDIQLSINNLKSNVLNIMQSNEGYIFASLDSGSILIFKLLSSNSYQLIQEIKGHNARVTKIIQIKDGRFISCSNDKTIKIWNFLDEELILDKTLNEYKESGISSIIEFKENEIISTPYKDGSIVFWSLQELKIIEKINNIKCDWDWNVIEKINEDSIIVGGRKSLYLIKNYKLVIDIKIDSYCYCICYLSNGYILTGHKNGNIKEWKLISNKLKFIGEKKVHEKLISVIYEIKNNFLLSGSHDNKINFYKIEYN